MKRFFSIFLLVIFILNSVYAQSARDPSNILENIWNDISNFFEKDISSTELPQGVKDTIKFVFKTQEELTLIRLVFLMVIVGALTYIIYLSIKIFDLRALKGAYGWITAFIVAILFSFVGALGAFAETWFNIVEFIFSGVKFLAGGSALIAVLIFVLVFFLIKKGISLINKKFEQDKALEAGEEAGLGLRILRREAQNAKKRHLE